MQPQAMYSKDPLTKLKVSQTEDEGSRLEAAHSKKPGAVGPVTFLPFANQQSDQRPETYKLKTAQITGVNEDVLFFPITTSR